MIVSLLWFLNKEISLNRMVIAQRSFFIFGTIDNPIQSIYSFLMRLIASILTKLKHILFKKRRVIVEKTVEGIQVTVSIPIPEVLDQDRLANDLQKFYEYELGCLACHINAVQLSIRCDPEAGFLCSQSFRQHLQAAVTDDAQILLSRASTEWPDFFADLETELKAQ